MGMLKPQKKEKAEKEAEPQQIDSTTPEQDNDDDWEDEGDEKFDGKNEGMIVEEIKGK